MSKKRTEDSARKSVSYRFCAMVGSHPTNLELLYVQAKSFAQAKRFLRIQYNRKHGRKEEVYVIIEHLKIITENTSPIDSSAVVCGDQKAVGDLEKAFGKYAVQPSLFPL